MRAVLQRVTRAGVRVEGETVGEIGPGLLVLLGVARDDTEGRMNLSVVEARGALLVVSQFTLYGDARRGRRPSWIDAAPPEVAEPLYEFFVRQARSAVDDVATGKFQAMMQVELV